jgi:hypothetical protein
MRVSLEELLNPEAKIPESKQELLRTIAVLASAIVAIIAALANKEIPTWQLIALGSIVLILLGFSLWTPVVSGYRGWTAWRARNRAARAFYPDVAQMMRRLDRQLADNYTGNLVYELRNFVSVRTTSGINVVENLNEFSRITEWMLLFAPKAARQRAATFADVVRAMNVAVGQYWWLCNGIHNRLQGIVVQGLLDDKQLRNLRHAWNDGREGPNKFFTEWADLNERINAQLPESLGSADRSTLKSLV